LFILFLYSSFYNAFCGVAVVCVVVIVALQGQKQGAHVLENDDSINEPNLVNALYLKNKR